MARQLPGGRGANKGPDAAVNNAQWLANRAQLAPLGAQGVTICPRGTVLFVRLSDVELEHYFPNHQTRGTGPYTGWALCDGNYDTPDLLAASAAFMAVNVWPLMKVF